MNSLINPIFKNNNNPVRGIECITFNHKHRYIRSTSLNKLVIEAQISQRLTKVNLLIIISILIATHIRGPPPKGI